MAESPTPTKTERKAAAREQARILREERQKRAKRRKLMIQGGVAVGIIAVIAIVALIVTSVISGLKASDSTTAVAPKNMPSNGITFTKGVKPVLYPAARKANSKPVAVTKPASSKVVSIQVWNDYMCTYCNQFERINGEDLKELVNDGTAQVTMHPISFLDSASSSKYSTRSANAAAAVANYAPNAYWEFNALLYANYPGEGSVGLSDAQLKKLAATAIGSTNGDVDKAIDKQTFVPWVEQATKFATEKNYFPGTSIKKFPGTPTITINGQQYGGNYLVKGAFTKAVEAAAK